MTTRAYGFDRRNEATKGLIGASVGFALLGPIGAGIGGFIGAKWGSSEDEQRLYDEECDNATATGYAEAVEWSFLMYDEHGEPQDVLTVVHSYEDFVKAFWKLLNIFDKQVDRCEDPAEREKLQQEISQRVVIGVRFDNEKLQFTPLSTWVDEDDNYYPVNVCLPL